MKKTKKLFVGVALAAMLLSGCNGTSASSAPYSPGQVKQQDIYELYKLAGGEMTYEEWLTTVKGADGAAFYADGVDPVDTAGKEGDVFMNIATWDLFLKLDGTWHKICNLKGAPGADGKDGKDGVDGKDGKDGKDGVDGKDGKDGVDGKDGKDGVDGKDGKDGKDGADGSIIHTGYGRPADTLGKDTDVFIDLETFDFYVKANGHWILKSNMKQELSWDLDIAAEMSYYLGEPLPFADLNPDTMRHFYDDYYQDWYGFDLYVINDDSEFNVLEDYGEKLLRAGFVYAPEDAEYYGEYIKINDRGFRIEVKFAYYEATADYAAGNEIDVYMDPFVPPMDADYFLDNGFVAVDEWPEANVAETMAPYAFAQPENAAAPFYEYHKKIDAGDEGSYFAELIGVEGSFKADVFAQAEALGFYFDEDYNCYINDDDDAQINAIEQDGFTLIKLFGVTIPPEDYTEQYFIDAQYTKVAGFPTEQVEEALGDDAIEGANLEGDWFYTHKKNQSSYEDKYYCSTKLATAGDFTAELKEQIVAAGFTVSDTDPDYFKKTYTYNNGNTDTASVRIEFKRGYTCVSIVGAWIYPNGEPPAPEKVGVDQINDTVVAYYAAKNITVTAPEYLAADLEAYIQVDDNVIKVSNSDVDDMAVYETALAQNGWTINHYSSYFQDDFKAFFGDTNACLKIEDYYSYVKISMTLEAAPVPPKAYTGAEVAEEIEAFFLEDYELEVEVPAYVLANEEGSFEWQSSYYTSNDAMVFDTLDSDPLEMIAYAVALEEAGWVGDFQENGNAVYTYGETGATIQLIDGYEAAGIIRIAALYVAPASNEFPLAELNAFLAQYELGFQLTEAIPDFGGEGYFYGSGVIASGYHYFYIDIAGDHVAEVKAFLEPIVTAAGYAWDDEYGCFTNAAYHEVQVYMNDYGETEICFFE